MKAKNRIVSTRFLRSGLFLNLANWAAFVHTIKINIEFVDKPILGPEVREPENEPIARVNGESVYGRRLDVELVSSGNPVRVWYARLKHFPNVPLMQVEVRSELMPITALQLILALRGVTGWNGEPLKFSFIEFTTDVSGFSVRLLRQQAFFRAHTQSDKRDALWNRTFYAGKSDRRGRPLFARKRNRSRVLKRGSAVASCGNEESIIQKTFCG